MSLKSSHCTFGFAAIWVACCESVFIACCGSSAAEASPPKPFTSFVVFFVPTAASCAYVEAISEELYIVCSANFCKFFRTFVICFVDFSAIVILPVKVFQVALDSFIPATRPDKLFVTADTALPPAAAKAPNPIPFFSIEPRDSVDFCAAFIPAVNPASLALSIASTLYDSDISLSLLSF